MTGIGAPRMAAWFGAAALLLAPLLAGEARAEVADPHDAMKVVVEATARGDFDALAALYAPDAILLAPGAPAFAGREAIRAIYRHNAAQGRNSIAFTDMKIDSGADRAVVMWTWVSETVPKSGKAVRVVGRSLVYFKNTGQGWLISADMFQPGPKQ